MTTGCLDGTEHKDLREEQEKKNQDIQENSVDLSTIEQDGIDKVEFDDSCETKSEISSSEENKTIQSSGENDHLKEYELDDPATNSSSKSYDYSKNGIHENYTHKNHVSKNDAPENDATENDSSENDAPENDTHENDAPVNDAPENDAPENDITENYTHENGSTENSEDKTETGEAVPFQFSDFTEQPNRPYSPNLSIGKSGSSPPPPSHPQFKFV